MTAGDNCQQIKIIWDWSSSKRRMAVIYTACFNQQRECRFNLSSQGFAEKISLTMKAVRLQRSANVSCDCKSASLDSATSME